ncbi:hypothetical protein HK101_005302 [Irineochytrium annulatum]|nr:hypothetical protein HK101_005302 [Irineochytrium annulatum]
MTSLTALQADDKRDDISVVDDDDASVASSLNRPVSSISVHMNPNQYARGKDDALKWKKEAERWQYQYERQILDNQKEIGIFEARIAKLDALLSKAVKEKNSLGALAASREKEISELNVRQTLLRANVSYLFLSLSIFILTFLQLEKSEKASIAVQEKLLKSSVLQRKVDELEKQSGKIKSLADRKNASVDKLQRERDDLQALAEGLKAQVETLTGERERLEKDMESIELAKGIWESRVQELEALIEKATEAGLEKERALKQDIENLAMKEEKLAREKGELEIRLDGLVKALSLTRQERDKDRQRVEDLEEKILAADQRRMELEGERLRLQQEIARGSDHVAGVLKRLEGIEVEYSQLLAQRDELRRQNGETAAENLSLRESVADLTSARQELARKLSVLQESRDTDANEYQDVVATLRAAVLRLERERAKDMEDYDSKMSELSHHLGSALAEIESRQMLLDQKAVEEEEARVQLEQQERALLAAKEELEASWQKIAMFEASEAALNERNSELSDELSVLRVMLEEKDSQFQSSQKIGAAREKEVVSLQAQLRSAQSALNSARNTNEEQLAAVEQRIEELTAALEEEKRYREGERNMSEVRIAQEIAKLQDERRGREEEESKLQGTISALRSELAARMNEYMEKAEAGRHEIGQIKYSLVEAEEIAAELRERARDDEMALEEASNLIESLEEKQREQQKKFSEKVRALEASLARAQQERDDTLTDKTAIQAELELALRLSKDENTALSNEIDEMTKLLTIAKEREKVLAGLEEELYVARANLKTANEELINVRTRLDETVASMSAQISMLETRAIDLQRRLEDEEELADALQNKLEAEISRRLSDVDAMAGQLIKIGVAFSELEAELELSRIETQDTKAEMYQLKTTLSQEHSAHLVAKKSVCDLTELLSSSREKNASLSSLYDEVRSSLDHERISLHEATANIAGLTDMLHLEREEHRTVQGRLQTDLKVICGERDVLAKQLDDESRSHATVAKEVDRLSALLERESAAHDQTRTLLSSEIELRKIAEIRIHDLEISIQRANEAKVAASGQHELERAEWMRYGVEMKEKLQAFESALTKSKCQQQERDERITKLSLELAQRNGELEQLRSEHAILVGRQQQAEREADSNRGLVKTLEKAQRALAEREETLKELGRERQAMLLKSANEVGRKELEIKELKERLAEKQKELEGAKAAVEEVEIVRKDLQKSRQKIIMLEDDLSRERHEAEIEIGTVKEEMMLLNAENHRLLTAIEAAERDKADVEDTLLNQRLFLEKNYKDVLVEMNRVNKINANLIGHQNNQQKIKHFAKVKDELMKLKAENAVIVKERDQFKRRNLTLERDLEAYKAVPMSSSYKAHRPETSFLDTSGSFAPASNSFVAPGAPKPFSRVKRAVLANRGVANEGSGTAHLGSKVKPSRIAERDEGGEEDLDPEDHLNKENEREAQEPGAYFMAT